MTRFLALGPLCLACLAAPAAAEVVPAPLFGDHMVLQAGVKAPVFGTTEPGGVVAISAHVVTRDEGGAVVKYPSGSFGTVTANDDGRWESTIGPFDAGAELRLIVAASGTPIFSDGWTVKEYEEQPDTADRKVFTDVLVGDVWLCSGQPNMQWELRQTIDADREIQSAKNDEIRLFSVPRTRSTEPQTTLPERGPNSEPADCRWVKLSPEAAAKFSAVGYYFGQTVHEATGRPVGLIDSSWGGTPSEAWTRPESLDGVKTAGPLLERWENTPDADTQRPHHRPGVLNNAMIAPLAPYALRGAIWYQGEANAGRAEQYDDIFPAMIEDWREQFGQNVPFFWVQLANFRAPTDDANAGSDWAELREAQDNTLDDLKNVGQAVIIDIGEANDIHPRNKEDVGERLALSALKTVYGVEKSGLESPRFKSVELNGATATITFETDGDALQNRRDDHDEAGGQFVRGFAVAGPDQTFYWATAEIADRNTVTVAAPAEVKEIVAVRYGWADNPQVTLFNTRGLPAAPFRTDDWPRVTAGKY